MVCLHGLVSHSLVSYSWYGMLVYGIVLYGIVWYCMTMVCLVWYDFVWYGMQSKVWYSMTLHGITFHSMVWNCIVWHGIVYHGVDWDMDIISPVNWYDKVWKHMKVEIWYYSTIIFNNHKIFFLVTRRQTSTLWFKLHVKITVASNGLEIHDKVKMVKKSNARWNFFLY